MDSVECVLYKLVYITGILDCKHKNSSFENTTVFMICLRFFKYGNSYFVKL